jgi:hypothetical protein
MPKERKQTYAERRPDGSRRFPQMEKIFDGGERQAVMERIEKTCRALDEQALCRRDVQPQPGVVELTDYLPFLAAE